MKNNILTNHENEIAGIISMNDRILIRGSLTEVAYSGGMNSFLSAHYHWSTRTHNVG